MRLFGRGRALPCGRTCPRGCPGTRWMPVRDEAALEALAAERFVLLDLNHPRWTDAGGRSLRQHDLETCVLIFIGAQRLNRG